MILLQSKQNKEKKKQFNNNIYAYIFIFMSHFILFTFLDYYITKHTYIYTKKKNIKYINIYAK